MSDSNDEARSNLLSFLPRERPDGREHLPLGASTSPSLGATGGRRGIAPWSALWAVVAAHAGALRRAEVLDDEGFAAVALALDAARQPPGSPPGDFRVEVAAMEERIDAMLPHGLSGAATLGLAREEWLATASRMLWRDMAIHACEDLLGVADTTLALADVHAVTVMPALLGGRLAQPTTLAHFLGGLIGPLRANRERLVGAFERLDRGPLGSGILAGDVLGLDREDLADRLGFAGIVPNTLDALASVEDVIELLDALASAAAVLHRSVREIGLWMRTDPTSFVLDESWTALPEPAQPTLLASGRLDALDAALAETVTAADALAARLRQLPYGPLGAAHGWLDGARHHLDDLLARALRETHAFLREGLIVNRAYLGNRAGRGYTTAGDLATYLMTEEQIDPTSARRIAAFVLARLQEANLEVSGITQDMIDAAAMLVIGREVKVEIESLGRFLAPRRFLERRQGTGSPAPAMVREWLAAERSALDGHRAWLDRRRSHVAARLDALTALISDAAADRDG